MTFEKIWYCTVKLPSFHSSLMTFEQKRIDIVRRLRDSNWKHISDSPRELLDEVNALGETRTQHQFDQVWARITALADKDQIWIDTDRPSW